MSPIKKALSSLAVVAVVAFSAGSMVSQLVVERTGVLKRMDEVEQQADRAERIAVRDSARMDALEIRQEQIDELIDQVDELDDLVRENVDRTRRIQCILSGGRGPTCI